MVTSVSMRGSLLSRHRWPYLGMTALVVVWMITVLAGLLAMWQYAATPGDGAHPPSRWPAASKLEQNGRHTLLLFAHPQCPCTGATLAELERLIALCSTSLSVHVLFIAPDEVDSKWHDTVLVRTARALPRVHVHLDESRRESATFRVRTSGSCLVYDPAGRLVFNGGLTIARGHEGTSDGSRAILTLLDRQESDLAQTQVFGCPLFEPPDKPRGISAPSEKID